MSQPQLYIGLMSGTSVDAIDAALVSISPDNHIELRHTLSHPLPLELKTQIFSLFQAGDNEVVRLGQLDRLLAETFADATLALCKNAGVDTHYIRAIGSHGQTIRHHPTTDKSTRPFTLQIGDGNTLATRTGIITTCDFRRKDMALGGQGAPLVPAFHRAVFANPSKDCCVINIGGMSNITLLSANGHTAGYDTGPGNALMDAWIQRHKSCDYDAFGDWANQGQINSSLLIRLLEHPFFAQHAPKSTGRETFNLAWLDAILAELETIDSVDVMSTLTELTARSIAKEIINCDLQTPQLYLCGGGAHNTFLLSRLRQQLPTLIIRTTESLGIPPDWVEAVAFAWLAKQRIEGRPGNIPAVTGASREAILGALYLPD